jgi:succinate dehydrogenase / fumarate reductase cytochrome b subunit
MPDNNRPLSPHVGIYKWQVSNTLSILHRATGVFLMFGAFTLGAWIVSVALGPAYYDALVAVLGGPIGLLLLFGLSGAFFYHFGNGIRHLFWDAGYGFDQQVARYTGWATFVAAVLFTLLFWWGVNS